MDYSSKYKKYKTKYLLTKRDLGFLDNQKGGSIPDIIEYQGDKPEILKDYKQILTTGRHNCGIFISEKYPKRIIKCDYHKKSDVDQYTKKFVILDKIEKLGYHIFPKVYNFYMKDGGNRFIEMERFDSDLEELFYKEHAKRIFEKNKFDESIWFMYEFIMFYNDYSISFQKIYMDKVLQYFYENPEKLNDYEKLYTDHNFETSQDFDFQGMKITKYNDPKSIRFNLNLVQDLVLKLLQYSQNPKIYDSFGKFVELLDKELGKLLNEIKKQITMAKIILNNLGYRYGDNKLDNFAYILSDENAEHLGVKWINNIIDTKHGNKYFFIYIIDFEILMEDKNESGIIRDYNTNIIRYASPSINKIISIHNYKNILNLPPDIFKILETSFELNYPPFDSLEKIKENILKNP
jgi:hypothetical protein